MPAKKSQINGFWLFAQYQKSNFKRQGLPCDTNEKLLSLANALWKELPPEGRKEWDTKAKEERRCKHERPGLERLDNIGNVISARKDPVEEARKRREREINGVTSQWHGRDLTQERFYLIYYEYLVMIGEENNVSERMWLPREVAMVEYSLKRGIIKTLHQFIWPDEIPTGYTFVARHHSELTHQIPAERMTDKNLNDTSDFKLVWHKMLDIVKDSVRDGQYPPLYCLTCDYEQVKCMTDYLWVRGGRMCHMHENPLRKIYSLNDMVAQLLAFTGSAGMTNISSTSITSQLDGSHWDYIPKTACEFHEKKEISRFCALANVRKYCYTISDILAPHFCIVLSEHHVPAVESSAAEEVAERILPSDRLFWKKHKSLCGRDASQTFGDAGRDGRSPYVSERSTRGNLPSIVSSDEEFVPPQGDESHGMAGIYPAASTGDPGTAQASQLEPALGQFSPLEWPSLAAGEGQPSELRERSGSESSSPVTEMSSMSLQDARPTLNAPLGRGTSTPWCSATLPPPALGRGGGRGLPQVEGFGRGMRTQPPLSRAADPDLLTTPSSLHAVMGRGLPAGIGRGAGPMGAQGFAPPVGRGHEPPSVSLGSMPKGDASGRGAARVGRGYAPVNTADFKPG